MAPHYSCNICGESDLLSDKAGFVKCRSCSQCACHQKCLFDRERLSTIYKGWTEFAILGAWNCDTCAPSPIFPEICVDEFTVNEIIRKSDTIYTSLVNSRGSDDVSKLMKRISVTRKQGKRPDRPIILILKLLFRVEDVSIPILELAASSIADALLRNFACVVLTSK